MNTVWKTLREAAALTRKLDAIIGRFDVTSTVTVNQYTPNLSDKISDARVKLDEQLVLRSAAIMAWVEIRKLLGAANTKHGVNDKLTELAGLNHQLTELKHMQYFTASVEIAELENRFSHRNRSSTTVNMGGYSTDSVTVGLWSESEIDALPSRIRQLELRITDLNDELAAINALSKLELPVPVVDALGKLELL